MTSSTRNESCQSAVVDSGRTGRASTDTVRSSRSRTSFVVTFSCHSSAPFCFLDAANLHVIGPGGRAASHPGTTQCPAESPARGDQRTRIPQAHDGIVPRRRPVPLQRCDLWCEEITGRGEYAPSTVMGRLRACCQGHPQTPKARPRHFSSFSFLLLAL